MVSEERKYEYWNSYSKNFIQDKELKESILMEKPVLNNIEHMTILADVICEQFLIDEGTIEKIQNKTLDIYGPWANMWHSLERLNVAQDKTVDVDMEHLLSCTQQIVLLLGHSLNTRSCMMYQKDIMLYYTV